MIITEFSWKKILLLAVLAVIFLILLFFSIPKLAKPAVKLLPASFIQQAGDFITIPYISTYGICNNPAGTAALDKLTENITSKSNINLPIKIIVINNFNTIEAFATPDNKIILSSGLINFTANLAELAGILAHEIAHLVNQDPEVEIIRDNGLFITLMLMFGKDPNLSHKLLTFKYSRDVEFTADTMAIQYLNNAKITTQGLLDALGKLQGDPQRLARIAEHPQVRHKAVLSATEWAALRNICATPESLR